MLSIFRSWYERCRHSRISLFNIIKQPISFYSMQLGHIGFALCIISITCVSTLDIEKDLAIQTNKKTTIGDFDFVFHGIEIVKVDNYIAQRGKFDVYKNDKLITQLFPEKRRYPVQQSTMTEAAIDAGFTHTGEYGNTARPVAAQYGKAR
ncbi:MAG: cytochrome c-type biogenesis CcmF C-terminal domain-containing protein [Planctomycetota bacterium]